MKMARLFLLIILSLFFVSVVSAFSFTADVNSNPSTTPYEGETVSLQGSVTPIVSGGCKLVCKWTTADFGENLINGGQGIPDGARKDFNYQTIASGSSGVKQFTLEVSCKRSGEGLYCLESEWITNTYNLQFSFGRKGDNICQVNKGKECTSTLGDCPCTTSGTACIGSLGSGQWAGRNPDDRKCVSYCGNGVKEHSYETCSSCPNDVGQCNGYVGCVSGNQCEGGFCVHEACTNKPYIEGDNFCDLNEQENCKNSQDCACSNGEICSNTGMCQKQETSKEEVTQAVQQGVQETLKASESRQKNITLGTIGLIVLIIIGYLIFKFNKSKKIGKDDKNLAVAEKENKKKTKVR